MVTYEDVLRNESLRVYIKEADASLGVLEYTEHSFAHVGIVADRAGKILTALGADERQIELAKIAGYMHDVGNLVNRVEHSQSGALIAFRILDKMGMSPEDIAIIVSAIGNHDEGTGVPVNDVAAALIIADKTDVRRTRVRNADFSRFDIHDRVNYSAEESRLDIDTEARIIRLSLTIDTSISSIMDYFEIFLQRMLMCRRSAARLGLTFKLFINEQELI